MNDYAIQVLNDRIETDTHSLSTISPYMDIILYVEFLRIPLEEG